jgi:DNA topoisomerase-2
MPQLKAILKENPGIVAAEREAQAARARAGGEEAKEESDDGNEPGSEIKPSDYDYLLSMALWSLSEERVAKLEKEMDEKKALAYNSSSKKYF